MILSRYDDPATLVITHNSDGVLSECGFTGCGATICNHATVIKTIFDTMFRWKLDVTILQ